MDFWKDKPQQLPPGAEPPTDEEYVAAAPIIPARQNAAPPPPPRQQPQYFEQLGRTKPARRLGSLRRGCRRLGCLLMLLLVGSFFFLGYVLIARPPQIWEPFKVWLNNDLQAETTDANLTPIVVYERLQTRVKDFQVGDNSLEISATELQVLIDSEVGNIFPTQVFADISADKIRLFWNIEADASVPLWMIAEFTPDQTQKLVLSRVGTNRIGLPPFLNQAFANLLLSGLKLGRQREFKDLLSVVLSLPENVTVKEVKLTDDKATIIITIATGLDNLFRP